MGIKLKKTKNTKNTKKGAMALMLLLVILTSLAFIIAGSMKLLSVSDKFSINRFSKNSAGAKFARGHFICYKKKSEDGTYKLYQQRVDFKSDGSKETEVVKEDIDECEFEIPSGVKNITITLVGAGGKGITSNVMRDYDIEDCGSIPEDDACNSVMNYIKQEKNCEISSLEIITPKLVVMVGSEGKPGEAIYKKTDNIKGPDGNRDKITIKKDEISDPTTLNSTTFKYYYKDSKEEYQLISLEAKAGNNGEQKIKTITSAGDFHEEAKQGITPTGLVLPSSYLSGLNNLDSGSVEEKTEDGKKIYTAKDATYFGASGASQEITLNDSDVHYLANCTYYKYTYENDDEEYTDYHNASNYNFEDDRCKREGTVEYNVVSDGAPGAILISW